MSMPATLVAVSCRATLAGAPIADTPSRSTRETTTPRDRRTGLLITHDL
jgi:hypothetical protein